MKKTLKWISALAVFALLITSFSFAPQVPVRAEDTLEDLYEKLAALNTQQRELSDAIELAQGQIDEELIKIGYLEAEIHRLEDTIFVYNEIIFELDTQITTLELELKKSEGELSTYYDIFYERVRVNYESGQTTYMEVLLGAGSFTDYLTRIDVVEQLMVYDNNLIRLMNETIEKIDSQKTQLTGVRAENKQAKDELAAEQDRMQALHDESQALVKSLGKKIASYEAKKEKAEEDKDALNKKIDELIQAGSDFVGGEWMWPVPGSTYVTSRFGYRKDPFSGATKFHGAIDIGCRSGTNLYATNSGTVVASTYEPVGGYYIVIDHGGGYSSRYFHLSKQYVKAGDIVGRGELIGLTGNSGSATTGPHLHFEIRIKGSDGVTRQVDPLLYVVPY